MQVILLEKIANVGVLGDLVDVKSGYARNFLLPQGKAQIATADNVEAFSQRRAELEQQQADALGSAQARAAQLEGLSITVTSRAGSEGKLFGSVGADEIRSTIEATGVKVAKKEIRLPEGPLRNIGEHAITVHLFTDVDVEVTVVVVGEDG